MNYQENVDKIIEQLNNTFTTYGLAVSNGWTWDTFQAIRLKQLHTDIAAIRVEKDSGAVSLRVGKTPVDLSKEQEVAIVELFNKVQSVYKANKIEEELKNLIDFNTMKD